MAAAASRVSRGRNDGCGFGEVKGGSRVPFIGTDVPLACGPRRGRGGTGSDSGEVPARPELGDDPDRRAPPVGRPRVRGAKTRWAGRKK